MGGSFVTNAGERVPPFALLGESGYYSKRYEFEFLLAK
jgi:hypothetical protein